MSDYPRLFSYDLWANHEVLRALKAIAAPPARSVKLIAHIVGTQFVWYARMTGAASPAAVWPEWRLDETASQCDIMAEKWRHMLQGGGAELLSRTSSYTNTKGERWSSRNDDVLMHVVMHGAYHRGQIAADIRASGNEPPYTDYIQAARAGLLP